MYGVGTDVAAATFDIDLDDHQIVDMFKILADGLFSEPGITTANDKIASSTEGNLVRDMAWQDELAIAPTYFYLLLVNGRQLGNKAILICLLVSA